ncbi:hypothetical protein Ct9H90mP29_17680 [bacterium]|nr:MAG: hypothetical protein Ct9H90mP29_17680 [bacterium]
MDNETYEQLNVDSDSVGDGKDFLTAGLNVDLLFDGMRSLMLDYLSCNIGGH